MWPPVASARPTEMKHLSRCQHTTRSTGSFGNRKHLRQKIRPRGKCDVRIVINCRPQGPRLQGLSGSSRSRCTKVELHCVVPSHEISWGRIHTSHPIPGHEIPACLLFLLGHPRHCWHIRPLSIHTVSISKFRRGFNLKQAAT